MRWERPPDGRKVDPRCAIRSCLDATLCSTLASHLAGSDHPKKVNACLPNAEYEILETPVGAHKYFFNSLTGAQGWGREYMYLCIYVYMYL